MRGASCAASAGNAGLAARLAQASAGARAVSMSGLVAGFAPLGGQAPAAVTRDADGGHQGTADATGHGACDAIHPHQLLLESSGETSSGRYWVR